MKLVHDDAFHAQSNKRGSHSDDPSPTAARSELMRRVASKDTTPELIVRSLVHSLGYRFRLQRRDLPGTPDLVFPRHRKIIFVHGCFWHRHAGCSRTTTPKTRHDFWKAKFRRNVQRDREVVRALRNERWEVLIVWECETRHLEKLSFRIATFLDAR